jgi:hypothetical protein
MFHLKLNQAQNDETNRNIEFLQPYPAVAADVLLEIGTVVISAVRRSMSTCLRQKLPVSRNFVTSRCTVFLFRTSLSGYALVNALRKTAVSDFYAK